MGVDRDGGTAGAVAERDQVRLVVVDEQDLGPRYPEPGVDRLAGGRDDEGWPGGPDGVLDGVAVGAAVGGAVYRHGFSQTLRNRWPAGPGGAVGVMVGALPHLSVRE